MEPKSSLQCSQEPTTGLYAERDQSRTYRPVVSFLRSILILSSQLRLGLPSALFPLDEHTDRFIILCFYIFKTNGRIHITYYAI
jgi:hypothetical protein